MTDNKNKQTFWQFIKFTMFSASAGVIQFASCAFLLELTGLEYWIAYLISLILSVVYNFTVNRRFTFKSANNYSKAMFLVFLYYCVFTPLSTWWGDALVNINWNEFIVLAGTMIINFATEFLYHRFFVFRKSINTNDLAN
ncbi:MAG: polysaccharide synthesis protein GtrA [Clostridiales bacterium GWF2_36_10]|nr:MAG: polysaccharide synthesis protein GtrA [Clostridiales bacterium GWF2_36_10]HAN21192.1 GtrA family protein [Clostridiales bacterium]